MLPANEKMRRTSSPQLPVRRSGRGGGGDKTESTAMQTANMSRLTEVETTGEGFTNTSGIGSVNASSNDHVTIDIDDGGEDNEGSIGSPAMAPPAEHAFPIKASSPASRWRKIINVIEAFTNASNGNRNSGFADVEGDDEEKQDGGDVEGDDEEKQDGGGGGGSPGVPNLPGAGNGNGVAVLLAPPAVPPAEAPGAIAEEQQGTVGNADEGADCKLLGVFLFLVALCLAGMAGLPLYLSRYFLDWLPQLYAACILATGVVLWVAVEGLLSARVIEADAARRLRSFFTNLLSPLAAALLDVRG